MVNHDAESGCWLWRGALHSSGYGMLGRGRRREGIDRAHRIAWELAFGPIPSGFMVLHACDVRACCNPGHLFLGTAADNSADMSAKGRHSTPAAKITPADVVQIRLKRKHGATIEALSLQFRLKPRQIRRIVRGERWKHVA